jgi:hypothetical protein
VRLSARTKLFLGVAALVGLVVYATVVELGVNAGRVHFGVSVRGLDLGGVPIEEAEQQLRERARLVGNGEIMLAGKGLQTTFRPCQVGWRARWRTTAELAAGVGRGPGLLDSVGQRWRAWFGGVEVDWAGGAKFTKMTRLIDHIERRAAEIGFGLDRATLRGKIKRIINTWPRKPWYRIPLLESVEPAGDLGPARPLEAQLEPCREDLREL